MLSDRCKNMLKESSDPDGRLRTSQNPSGTKSFRVSGSETNLLAFPFRVKELTACMQADPGHVLIHWDFRSLEPTVQAQLSGDKLLAYATCHGIGKRPYWQDDMLWIDDIYIAYASKNKMFKEHFMHWNHDEWMENKSAVKERFGYWRDAWKGVLLSVLYGAQDRSVQKTLFKWTKILYPMSDVSIILNQIEQALPRLFATKKLIEYEAQTKGVIETFFNFPVRFRQPNDMSSKGKRDHSAFNQVVQTTAAGVMKRLNYEILDSRPTYLKPIIPNLHDAGVWQVPEDRVDDTIAFVEKCLSIINAELQWSIPLVLTYSYGKNLYEAK